MANTCIFCGKKLPLFGQEKLLCGNAFQSVCSQCRDTLWELSQEERGRRALDTGRAANPEQIEAFLAQSRETAQRARDEARRARQALLTDKVCLRCGRPMLRYGRKLIQLGSEGLFGPVTRDGIFSDWLEVDILRCEGCGKAEFFIPDESGAPQPKEEEEPVACPVCGTRHSPRSGCPTCAANMAVSGQRPRSAGDAGSRRENGGKPPWEK